MITEHIAQERSAESPTVLEVVTEPPVAGVGDEQGLTEQEVKRNMLSCILMDSTAQFGAAEYFMVSTPLLVFLHASNTIIGLITGAIGFSLLGIFVSPWISRRFRYKKWLMVGLSVPVNLPILICGLTVLFSHRLGISNHQLLVSVVALTLAQQAIAGFAGVTHQEYIAACIPTTHRGRLSGMSMSIGSAASFAINFVGLYILYHYAKPMSFAFLYLMAWFTFQSGIVLALFAKERPTPVEKSPAPWSRSSMKIIWNDKPLHRFLSVWVVMNLTFSPAMMFIGVYAYKVLHMDLANAAIFANIGMAARVLTSAPSGFIVDKYGPKRVIPFCSLGFFLGFLPVLIMQNAWGVYISIAWGSVLGSVLYSATCVLLYGLPKPEHRGTYYSLQMIVVFLSFAVGSLLIGRICDVVPYMTVFKVAAVLALVCWPVFRHVLSILSDDTKAYA